MCSTFKQEMEEVIANDVLSNNQKHLELSYLLSSMAVNYEIPLLYSEEYKNNNIEIIEVFEEIVKKMQHYSSN